MAKQMATYQLITLRYEGAHIDPAVPVDAWEGLSVNHELRWGCVDLRALAVLRLWLPILPLLVTGCVNYVYVVEGLF